MQRVLPIYLAVDTSLSMATGRHLEAIQESIILLAEELLSDPALGDAVRVAIVGFADDAQLVLPLSDLTELQSLPRMTASGPTRYGALFRTLSKVIERDVLGLQAHDTVPFRPAVFMITDGLPLDAGWQRAFADFERRSRALLVLIALGLDADGVAELSRELHPLQTYTWGDVPADVLAERTFQVISQYAMSLTRSTIVSTEHGLRPNLVLPLPDGLARSADGIPPTEVE